MRLGVRGLSVLVCVSVEQAFGVGELFEPDVADDVNSVFGLLQRSQVGTDTGATRPGFLMQFDHAEDDLRLDAVDRDLRAAGCDQPDVVQLLEPLGNDAGRIADGYARTAMNELFI